MKFFECNLEESGYWILNSIVRNRYMNTVKIIKMRHEKLNEALEVCECIRPIQAEAFSEYAADIFSKNPEYFDKLDATELASAIATLYDGRVLEKRVDWAGCRSLFDTRFASRKDWELLRIIGIGGSETATVQGVNHFECPKGLFHKKIGTPMKDYGGAVLDRGHIIEPSIYDWVTDVLGYVKVPEYRMMQSIEFPNCTANFDGIMRKPGTDEYYLFEAKTTGMTNHAEWAGSLFPANYRCQIDHYAGVLGDDRIKERIICCFFFDNEFAERAISGDHDCWFGGAVYDRVYRRVERNPEEERRILEDAQAFWDNYIEFGIEPANTLLDTDLTATMKIRAAAEIDTKKVVTVDLAANKELEKALRKYLQAEEERKEAYSAQSKATKLRDAYSSMLIDALGDAENGIFISGDRKYNITFKSTRKPTMKYDAGKIESLVGSDKIGLCGTLTPCNPSLKVVAVNE